MNPLWVQKVSQSTLVLHTAEGTEGIQRRTKRNNKLTKQQSAWLKSQMLHHWCSITFRETTWTKRQAERKRQTQKSQCPTPCNCSHVSDCECRHTQSLCLLQTLYLLCNQSHSNKKRHLERVKLSLQNTSYIMHPTSNIHAGGWQARRATVELHMPFQDYSEVCYCKLYHAEFISVRRKSMPH